MMGIDCLSRRRVLRGSSVLFLALLLTGCSGLARSVYTQPKLDLPAAWEAKPTAGGSQAANGDRWWQGFNDPLLSELVERALQDNNDLAAAAIRVRRAQLQSELTATNRTPNLSVDTNSTLSRDLRRGASGRSFEASATLNYELDLWGKLASARDAAEFEAKATEYDRQSTELSLVGTTAENYWQTGYLKELMELADQSIAYAEKTLALVEAKYAAGAVSALDLSQAMQALAGQRAERTQLVQQLGQVRNGLAILFDQAPQSGTAEPERLPDLVLPRVEAGLPATILARRPDLRAAEERLKGYLAEADRTRASYYPTLTLTGSLGGSSTSLLEVLRNPVAALGAGVTLPFVQQKTMQLAVQISETRYEEAVVEFRQTLYTALGEVENALSAGDQYLAQQAELEKALGNTKESERILEARYRAGLVSVQLWLDAQETRRGVERQLLENRLNRYRNRMTLCLALGGR